MTHAEAEDIVREAAEKELQHLSPEELPAALQWSNRLSKFVDAVGRFGSWFIVPLVLITVFDLGLRKTGELQLWLIENVSSIFGSTLLQELEWHSHTVLFTLVLAYGYIWNTHVRVDLVRENLAFKKKAWIEFIGLTFFFIPYCAVLLYFALVYAWDAYQIGEVSASLVGLSHRWIIKSVLVAGIAVVIVAGLAVWLQLVMVLFGPQNIRFPLLTVEWPEEEGSKIEGKERLDLSKAKDLLEARAKAKKAEAQPAE
ncbi:MAG: TRAP transporter small permease subunit [Alphaproteobacteria bacterium]|nr:TRAP transporter small permease subunit [Alphaproteobacteria bacterium]